LKETRIIEAALFSAGQPISIEELKLSTELKEKEIKNALKELIKEYGNRETAIEVSKVGDKYAMQLKPAYATHVQKFAAMEIPLKVLKTAALIAYHQPVKQSDLLGMVGHKVYDHVKILSDMGLIRRRESGRTKLITTTERFSEYFGISSTERAEIKRWLMEKMNIPMPEKVPAGGSDNSVDEPVEHVEVDDGSETDSEEIEESSDEASDDTQKNESDSQNISKTVST